MSIERGSDTHSARMDDALKSETRGLVQSRGVEPHAQEWKMAEPSGEDQPEVDRAPDAALHGGVPAGMTEADVEARSEIAVALGKDVYPAVREVLIDHAERAQATDRVLDQLRRLPAGREFHNVAEVWEALGHSNETQRF